MIEFSRIKADIRAFVDTAKDFDPFLAVVLAARTSPGWLPKRPFDDLDAAESALLELSGDLEWDSMMARELRGEEEADEHPCDN